VNWAYRVQHFPGYGDVTNGDRVSECGRYIITPDTGGKYIPLHVPVIGCGGGISITDPCDTLQEAEAACLRHQSEREDD
jgi:hypothetical protein